MEKIGYVILTWNSEKYISGCLHSIFEMTPKNYRHVVVVVDNGSTDGTRDLLDAEEKRYLESSLHLETIRLNKNEGTTRSRNLGLTRLLAIEPAVDWICILDSDTEVNGPAITTMIKALKNKPHIGIIGPRLHNAAGVYQVSGKNFSTLTGKLLKVSPIRSMRDYGERMETMIKPYGIGCIPVGYLMSACWLMRRDIFEQLGPLDEKIFYAPEDLEYCIRCWKRGYQVMYCYDADILHYWQRISRKKLFSKHNFEQIRGLIHIFVSYHYMLRVDKLWLSIRTCDGEKGKR